MYEHIRIVEEGKHSLFYEEYTALRDELGSDVDGCVAIVECEAPLLMPKIEYRRLFMGLSDELWIDNKPALNFMVQGFSRIND